MAMVCNKGKRERKRTRKPTDAEVVTKLANYQTYGKYNWTDLVLMAKAARGIPTL